MAAVDSAGLTESNGLAHDAPQEHHTEAHNPTIEEVVDEEDTIKRHDTPISTSVLEDIDETAPPAPRQPVRERYEKASNKANQLPKKENKPQAAPVDLSSKENFPELIAAKPQAPLAVPSWGAGKSSASAGNSTTASGAATPTSSTSSPFGGPGTFNIPGQSREMVSFAQSDLMTRAQMKKPIPDILKDINRKLKVTITSNTGDKGNIYFTVVGSSPSSVREAVFELADRVCVTQKTSVQIPASLKAQIIGKGGVTIKSIQEKTGARITMPKNDAGHAAAHDDDDDEQMVDVVIEGNTLRAGTAREQILKIVGNRANTINQKLRNIPAEFYPFIAGPNNAGINNLEESFGNLRVHVPTHHSWRGEAQAPPAPAGAGQTLNFRPSSPSNHISLTGEREAVQQGRAEIERQVEELRRQLRLEQLAVNRGRHQFIVGEQGIPVSQFLADTGCAIILPEDSDDETITIIGPSDRIEAAVEKATDLAYSLHSANVDISRLHRNAPQGANQHAVNVTRYLQRRREIERLQQAHNAHIVAQIHENTVSPWELYAREGKTAMRAQTEINHIVQGLPPSRMSTLDVNPFFHQHLQNNLAPKVQQAFGVYTVIADESNPNAPILLVFEGPDSSASEYQVPRTVPSSQEVHDFQRGLEEAQKYILDIINQQQGIKVQEVNVPTKFHAKLRKFIQNEKKTQSPEDVNVRVTVKGTTVTLQGTAQKVDDLAAKVEAFVAQEIEDEKERGHTTTFPYQQKLNSMLIGKGGSNINQLREKFDVDIKVDDGTVTLTGPPAKAEAAKHYIQKMEKQWADEATHILKVDPKYHRQLIGQGGNQIKKLETRYKVSIHFPRTARPAKEDDESSSVATPVKTGRRQQAEDEIEVKGPSRGADEARDEILSLLQYLKDTSHSATVTIQQSQVPSLIGQGGRALEELRQETGAKVDVPGAKDAKSETGLVDIEIKGTKAQVAAAKKAIEEKKVVFDDSVTKNIEIEKKHHRALIGPSGSILRQIVIDAGGADDRRELARTVQFPRDGAESNKVKVEGRKAVVDKIIERMLQIVAENESRVTETIDVPQSQHRHLIGRGGDAKLALQSKFKVNLDIPNRDSGKTNVKITGKPEDVEAAKAHILEITKEEEGETIQIPVRLHHAVSQDGQLFRKLQRDHGVKIDHAGHRTPGKQSKRQAEAETEELPLITDETNGPAFRVLTIIPAEADEDIPWVLRGEANAVAKARAQIAAALEQARSATHTGYLTLDDPRLNRYVIGQGGKTVNAIRKQSGCKIEVPKSGDSHAEIEIVGSLEGVEKAKELILKAVDEGAQSSLNHSNPRRD